MTKHHNVERLRQAVDRSYDGSPRASCLALLGLARGVPDSSALSVATAGGEVSATLGVLAMSMKLKMGLPAMAKVFSQVSDQNSRVEEQEDNYIYVIERCPVCWGRKSNRAICHAAVGLLQEGLRWVSGGKEFRVEEVSCVATGDATCDFLVFRDPIG